MSESKATSPRTTLIFFAIGIALALTVVELMTRFYARDLLLAVQTEQGRLGIEMLDFNARDLTKPAVVLIGGSDLREDLDLDLARPYFKDHGLQLFSFVMSARDPGNEKYQMISALHLGPRDVVVYSMSPEDFMETDESNPAAAAWESPSAYLERMRILDQRPSMAQYLTQVLAEKFAWVRYRDQLRHLMYPKAGAAQGIIWHQNGDQPDSEAATQAKLDKFKTVKNDAKIHLENNFPGMKFAKLEQARWRGQIMLVRLPRNPLFAQVYSPDFLAKYYATLKEMGVIEIGEGVKLNLGDFYDFNHLHSRGATKFTQALLPSFIEQVKGHIR